jgi:hypothetical protein
MINCERCGKEVKVPPSSGIKFCSKECRIGQKVAICKCGKEFITWAAKKAPKTCGNKKCYKSRDLSSETRDRMSNKLSSFTRIDGVYHKVCRCGERFNTSSKKSKLCSKCRQKSISQPFTVEQCKRGARLGAQNSLSSRKYSNVESSLGSLIPPGYKANDRQLLNGLEIDYLYDDLAVEYNGSWHYRSFHSHYGSTVLRDRRKAERLSELSYKHYIVGWAVSNNIKHSFLEQHAYYISQLFEEVSPFKFLYNRAVFVEEFRQLKNTTGKSGYICNNISNWFHSYRWYQRTSTHELNAIDCWARDRDKILANRQKYSTLKPVDLRRYFLLFDYTPSSFSDVVAKDLALQISGDVVVDPFAGYGNRLLGVSAAGKQYIGFDINIQAVNANRLIAHELDLEARCTRADSSKLEPIECDGLITCPPYEDKDLYGASSSSEYYDMIHDTFRKIKVRDKGFIVIKPSLVDVDRFTKALCKTKSRYEVNWGGLNRKSVHLVLVI